MTKKQRLFFRELLTSPSNTEAARRAGYSNSSARVSAHRNITQYNEFWLSLLVESEIDIHSLSRNLRAGINSKDESVKYRYTKLALEIIDRTLQAAEFQKLPDEQTDFSGEALTLLKKYTDPPKA